MHDWPLHAQYDPRTSLLELSGCLEDAAWPRIQEEVDRAFRRTACRLTIDLSHAECLPARTLGRLVHLCNCRYPGTIVRFPGRDRVRVA